MTRPRWPPMRTFTRCSPTWPLVRCCARCCSAFGTGCAGCSASTAIRPRSTPSTSNCWTRSSRRACPAGRERAEALLPATSVDQPGGALGAHRGDDGETASADICCRRIAGLRLLAEPAADRPGQHADGGFVNGGPAAERHNAAPARTGDRVNAPPPAPSPAPSPQPQCLLRSLPCRPAIPHLDQPLIDAAWANDVDQARTLIASGADVNAKDDTQQSAYLICHQRGLPRSARADPGQRCRPDQPGFLPRNGADPGRRTRARRHRRAAAAGRHRRRSCQPAGVDRPRRGDRLRRRRRRRTSTPCGR